jgi:hypothetical protein
MFFAKWISMHDILLLIPLPPTTVSSSVPTVIDLVTRSPMSRLTSLATSAAVTMLRLPVAFITSSLVVLSLKSAGAIYSTAYFLPMRRTDGRTCGLDDGANVVFSRTIVVIIITTIISYMCGLVARYSLEAVCQEMLPIVSIAKILNFIGSDLIPSTWQKESRS